MTLECAVNPALWVGDVVDVTLPGILDGTKRGVVESWQVDFSAPSMQVEVEIPV